MEFWGEEVKAGVPTKVEPHPGRMLHLSQAVLGESKKDKSNEPVLLSVKIDGKKFVIATLKSDSIPQWGFDLVFHKDFELSHNWKHGSVYFTGYHSESFDETDFSDEDDSEDDEIPIPEIQNGKVEPKAEDGKTAKASASKPKPIEPESDDEDDSDEDDSDEGGDSDGEDDSEDMDEDSDDEDGSESEEETPKKADGKKRANDSATKTPVSSKKAKTETPQKTDGKKGPIVSTPHPAKNAGKAAADAKKTPKSGGKFSCGSCEKSFASDTALKSHTQAKHK